MAGQRDRRIRTRPGTQTPGMLAPWLELPGVAEQVAEFSEASGLDLVRLGTTADADEIKDTAVTQPLIVALGSIVAGRLGLDSDAERVVAGHSVGELTAAAVAGALPGRGRRVRRPARRRDGRRLRADPDRHVRRARRRPRRRRRRDRSRRAHRRPTATAPARSSPPARWTRSTKLAAEPPAGARVRPLPVAGAFHTHYMAPAEAALATTPPDSTVPTRGRSCCPTPTARRSPPARI